MCWEPFKNWMEWDVDFSFEDVGGFLGTHLPALSYGTLTWRIISVSKWLITMVIVRPLTGGHSPSKWLSLWLINRGDPNHLQVLG